MKISILLRSILLGFFVLLISMAAYGQTATGDYMVGEEDMLQISVWGNPNLNCLVPVKPSGTISVPLLGEIAASGLTVEELRAKLEQSYSKFIKKPVVNVLVTAVNSYKVYLLGSGIGNRISGEISLKKDTTLLQLLSKTGALVGKPENSYILRDGKRLDVDFGALFRGDASKDLLLKSGDIVYISSSADSQIRVMGAVKAPSLVPYRSGMTALDAVIVAGGFNEFANENGVYIIRKNGNKTIKIRVKLKEVINGSGEDIPLRPGDLVNVKTTIF